MKIQSQLRSPSVTLQNLVGYVQDQQGSVPSYLALAELSRRKKLVPKAPAPTESVASQEVAQADPGIANLPLQDPNMFSEQSMAAGGIVAFSGRDGSDVNANPYGLTNYLADMEVPEAPKLDKAAYVGATPSLADAQKQRASAYTTSGIDSLLYDDVSNSVKERISGIDSDKKDAVANAMIMAGLGIAAGKSQNAITNIAEGIMPAMKGYTTDINRLTDRKDKLTDRQFAITEAKNKFLQTGADSDLRRVQDLENDRRAAERDFTKLDAQQQEKYADKKFQLEKDIKTLDADIIKSGIDFKLKEDGLSIQKMSADTQRMAVEKPEAFTVGYDNLRSSDAYKDADGVGKNKMVSELVQSISPSTAHKSLADSATIVNAANENTQAYFFSGPGKKQLQEAQAKGPAAEKALRDKKYSEEFARLARIAPTPTAAPTAAPATGVKFLGYE